MSFQSYQNQNKQGNLIRRETLDKNEEKIREVNVQIEEVNQLKKTKELEVKEMQGKIGNFKVRLCMKSR